MQQSARERRRGENEGAKIVGNPIPPALIQDPTAPTTRVRQYPQGAGLALYGATSGYNGFKPAAVAGSLLWELPVNDGTSNQALVTNGSGVLSWATLAAVPAGSSGELQYNNAGSFGGASGLTWNSSRLQLGGTTSSYPALKRSGAAIHARLADDSAFTDVYGKEYRAYETAGVKYVSLSHDGTNAKMCPSSGYLDAVMAASGRFRVVRNSGSIAAYFDDSPGTGLTVEGGIGLYGSGPYYIRGVSGSVLNLGSGNGTSTDNISNLYMRSAALASWNGDTGIARNAAGVLEVNNGTAGTYRDVLVRQLNPGSVADLSVGGTSIADVFHGWITSNTGVFAIRSNGLFGASNSATNAGAAVDIAWMRNAAGAWEANNGSAGALRDVKARTFYGVAQASTDVAVSAQAHASQGSTSPIMQVITSAGANLFRVLPDRTVVGPDMYLDFPTSTSGSSATGHNYIQCGYGVMNFNAGGIRSFITGAGLHQFSGYGGSDATLRNSDPGNGLMVKVIDHYGGANTLGKNITYCAGRPTGTAQGGSHKFQVAPSVGVSGTTFGTLIDALTLNSNCVLFIANSPSVPAIDPVGGGNLYVESGALKYRGSSGTITTIAAA